MNESHLDIAKKLVASTKPYLCLVEEECYLQREDRPGTLSVFKMAKYLYWEIVRQQKN